MRRGEKKRKAKKEKTWGLEFLLNDTLALGRQGERTKRRLSEANDLDWTARNR